MKAHFLLIALVLFGFTSCLQKDTPIVLPPHGDAITQTVDCGADYSKQHFYSLKDARIVHSSPVDSWHLAFENEPTGYGIFLNGGVGMALVKTAKNSLQDVSVEDCENEVWQQDAPNGKAEESAIGKWNENALTRGAIYIVRLDANNKKLIALRVNEVTDTYFDFEVHDLSTGSTTNCRTVKDPTRRFTYYDLELMKQIQDIEPISDSWDIMFTRYGFTFYDQNPPLPYIVTGVLSNSGTEIFKDSTASFYDIEAEIIPTGVFSSDKDVIGYNWKNYDFDLGIYHVRQNYNYIIHTRNNNYFKLRFLSFYNDNGVKGSPTFEFRQIQ